MAQNAYLSQVDPEWEAIEPHIPPGFDPNDLQAFRAKTAEFAKMMSETADKGPREGLKVIERTIPVGNDELGVKVYIPNAQGDEGSEGFPMLCMMHGGGWILNVNDVDEPLLRHTAVESRIVCVSGNYRKAPENKFPIPINDTVAIFKWALEHASEFSVNLSKGFIIGGTSSGANQCAGALVRVLKEPELEVLKDSITGQLLIAPLVIWPTVYPDKFKKELLSFGLGEDKHINTQEHVLAYGRYYHDNIDAAHPEASPLLAESTFKDWPTTYIQAFGLDLFRDEDILIERLLRDAGVLTKLDVYPGVPHCCHMFFTDFAATKKQKKDYTEGINWLLHRTK